MSESAAKMAAYAEYLETYSGNREKHEPGTPGCLDSDHCYWHHRDEPDNGDVYRSCGECFHVFVTEEDLQRENLAIRTGVWQADLRGQLERGESTDHSDAPVARPGSEIYHCPLCAHDF